MIVQFFHTAFHVEGMDVDQWMWCLFLGLHDPSVLNSSLQSQKLLFLNPYAVLLLVHPMDEALLISEAAPVLNSRYKHLLSFCFSAGG